MDLNENLNKQIKIFDDWIKTQEHLPQIIENIILHRFLDFLNGNLENAKTFIDYNYTLRNKHPKIFLNRDPLEAKLKLAMEVMVLLPLPIQTKEDFTILLCRLVDNDAKKFDFTEFVKGFIIVEDTRQALPIDNTGDIGAGEVFILDMAGISIRHIFKMHIFTLKAFLKYIQDAHCQRFKQIHLINSSSILPKLMYVLKPFLNPDIFNLMHFHLPKSKTLFEFVDQDLLPIEYGGKCGSTENIYLDWMDKVNQHRDYLMNEDYWKVDESKRRPSK